jgi:hypothetical protein
VGLPDPPEVPILDPAIVGRAPARVAGRGLVVEAA